jgi:membrane fusion protein (multidrug efflux system)
MKEKPPANVDIIIAENKDIPFSVEVNGTVLSEDIVALYPEVSGRLIYLNIPDGATVTEGTILAKINDAELQAQMEQQKAQLDIATKTENRLKKLLEVNGVNQADYDAALSQLNLVQANINVLKAQIDKTVIKAPFSGTLGLRQVSEGAYVTTQTLIGTLQKTDKTKIDFTVPEAYKYLVNIGKTIYIQTENSDKNLPAIISAIEPQINVTTRNFKVRALPSGGKLIPGSFAKVLLSDNRKGFMIPTNAVIPDAQSNQVIVVKNGKGVFLNVETGVKDAGMVEITKGLSIGDSVVVSGVLFVRPNAKVKVSKARKIKSEKLITKSEQ